MFFSTDSESPMDTEHWKSEKPLGLFCLGCSTLQHTVHHNEQKETGHLAPLCFYPFVLDFDQSYMYNMGMKMVNVYWNINQ